jgi:hypothetical protein
MKKNTEQGHQLGTGNHDNIKSSTLLRSKNLQRCISTKKKEFKGTTFDLYILTNHVYSSIYSYLRQKKNPKRLQIFFFLKKYPAVGLQCVEVSNRSLFGYGTYMHNVNCFSDGKKFHFSKNGRGLWVLSQDTNSG